MKSQINFEVSPAVRLSVRWFGRGRLRLTGRSPPLENAVGAGSDSVALEASLWAKLSKERIESFQDKTTGMINEFKLHFSLRSEFLLHFFVFRQTCVHIPHEANAEDTFSLSGSLSNDNGQTGSAFLSRLTRMARNRARFDPSSSQVYSMPST